VFSVVRKILTTEGTEDHRVSLPSHAVNHPFYLLLVGLYHLLQAVDQLPLGFDFIDYAALDFKGREGD